MDFLDPVKERRNRLKLLVGYCLVALAIGIATLVLLYQSYGYGIDKQGNITQNGLVFVSSQPSGAAIYLNGQRYKANTNTRVVVPADTYQLKISAAGYRDWQRPIVVAGGDVQHFDYPFLFPTKLKTSKLGDLAADPSVASQSLDRRWLLLGRADASGSFTLYDFKSPDKPVATDITLPDGSFTPGDTGGAQSWTVVEWAADNQHVLLEHTYTVKGTVSREYILLDSATPVDSVNLTSSLHLSQTETLNLFNNRTSQFYVYDSADQSLQRVNASDGSVVSRLEHILAFKPYGDSEVLYVTDRSPTGKTTDGSVSVVLQDGQKTITLQTLPAGATTYDLNLAQYSGDWYVAVGSNNSPTVYVYKDPQNQQTTGVDTYPSPWRRLPLSGATYVVFSANTQFLLAENGQNFVVYDFENTAMYRYHTSAPLDQPQQHATWMDGDRVVYVSGGVLQVFDYDYRNQQSLVTANAAYLPFFSPDYTYLYTLEPASGDAKPALASTPLVVKP